MKYLLVIALVLCLAHCFTIEKEQSIDKQITYLHNRLKDKTYWPKDQKYKFMQKWEHMKGIYQSRVHFNILDKRNGFLTA